MKLKRLIVLTVLSLSCGGADSVTILPIPSPTPTVEPSPPTPSPSPSPVVLEVCPPLVKWGAKVFNIMDGGFNPTNEIRAGGRLVIDSTPKFALGGPNGQPCNAEHPCGRECEDPRGGVWTKLAGDSPYEVQTPGPEMGFQVLVGKGPDGMSAGFHQFQVCPAKDLVDGLGVPVETQGNPCEKVSFTVLE